MATQAKRDYYEILGLGREATAPEIKAAVQKLVSGFQAAGKPKNIADVEEIRAIVTAYRVLSDEEKRRRYDQTGKAFIADPENLLVGRPDKLDELLKWLELQRDARSAADMLDMIV